MVLVLGVSVGLFSFVLDGGWSVRALVGGVLAIPFTAGAFLAFWVTSKSAPRPPVLGGGVALLAFGLPLIVIAPTVARGDAQGGLFYFALPFFQCLAALAGAGFGGLLAYARDRIAILRRPAAGRVATAVAVVAGTSWTGAIGVGTALFVRDCDDDPTDSRPPNHKDVPLHGQRIVFLSARDPDSFGQSLRRRFDAALLPGTELEIYAMTPDGTKQVRLTRNSCWEASPRLSPEGSKIAFHSERPREFDLFVMGADGRGERRLTRNRAFDGCAAWSPDASTLAYFHNNSSPQLRVMQPDGSSDRPLPLGKGPRACQSRYLDSLHISYIEGRALVVARLDGTHKWEMVNFGSDDVIDAVLSPDGSTVVVAKQFPLPDGIGHAEHLYLMKAGSSQLQRVTPEDRSEGSPSWSPDGSRIVFHSRQASDLYDNSADIFVMNSDGSGRIQLTRSPGADVEPHWGG